MTENTIRIGLVGAGANTKKRHIPGFRAIEGVEILGVVNRSKESTEKVAEEFDIAWTFPDWNKLVQSEDIDAVMIGTWPYMHCEVTCAALNAGKHVLCEARMAMNADEAHKMLKTAHDTPDLVKQVVPSPYGLKYDRYVKKIIAEGFLGELRELVVIGANDLWSDTEKPLHWRQDAEFSGNNILAMGILHESALRWSPDPVRVFAQKTLHEKHYKASSRSTQTEPSVPDSVQVMTLLDNGARGLYHMSGIDHFGPGNQIHLYGSEGSIKLEIGTDEKLWIGSKNDKELHEPEISAEELGGWRVEEEFINAIRGKEKVQFTDFATGVKYMEFTDAVHLSTDLDVPIDLPLAEYTPNR